MDRKSLVAEEPNMVIFKIEWRWRHYSGLRMITFSNVSEYLYSSSQAGVRITLSKQGFTPFPNTYGYSVGVGSYISVPIEYVSWRRTV